MSISSRLHRAVDDYELGDSSLGELGQLVAGCAISLAPHDQPTSELCSQLAGNLKTLANSEEQGKRADAETDELLATVRIVADALDPMTELAVATATFG